MNSLVRLLLATYHFNTINKAAGPTGTQQETSLVRLGRGNASRYPSSDVVFAGHMPLASAQSGFREGPDLPPTTLLPSVLCSRMCQLHVLAVMRAGRRIMWFGYGWGSRKDCMIAWDTAHDAVVFSYLLAYGQGKWNARGIILRLCTY